MTHINRISLWAVYFWVRFLCLWHLFMGKLTGTIWVHHKGGRYRLLYVADEATNSQAGRKVVVYFSLAKGTVHTRCLEEWNEWVLDPKSNGRVQTCARRFRQE